MSWQQALVNAQVGVNRAVFEMNRPGLPPDSRARKAIDYQYLCRQIEAALADLQNAESEIRSSVRRKNHHVLERKRRR